MPVHYTWQKLLTPSLLAAPASAQRAQRALRAREYESRRFPAGRSRRPTADVPATEVLWRASQHTRVAPAEVTRDARSDTGATSSAGTAPVHRPPATP